MISRTISSLQHPFVKYCVKLRTDKNFRAKEKKILIFGSKIIAEVSSLRPVDVLFETYLHSTSARAKETIIVSEEIIRKISGITAPEPVAAIVSMPETENLSLRPYLLVLDRISDPGNMGTLIRSALALGWDGVFLLDNCCDPFNDKALRAGKGSTFRIPIQQGNFAVLQKILGALPRDVYLADIEGPSFKDVSSSSPKALILSSESHGPMQEYKNQFSKISIPMPGAMESLNVAIAGGILLQHLRSV
jgi:TrmH family RNA methyltransferase